MKCNLDFKGKVWEDSITPAAQTWIKGLLKVKPKDRMTVDEALEHEWLQDADSNA